MSIYSIGYATKDIAVFIEQLKNNGINAVADIRSVPFSKVFFDYHQDTLQASLKRAGIAYVYLGDELGPRSKDPSHYNEFHQVQFDRLMQSDLFQQGIERLMQGVNKGYRIALTCAEKEPAVCHRSLLVGWALLHLNKTEITHIFHDGALETQSSLEKRLMTLTETKPDMFTTQEDALTLAYQSQCQRYAYKREV